MNSLHFLSFDGFNVIPSLMVFLVTFSWVKWTGKTNFAHQADRKKDQNRVYNDDDGVIFFYRHKWFFKAISQYSKKCENMVNFLLLLFQKSLIFPFEEICAALKKPLDFFSLVFFRLLELSFCVASP